VSPADSLLLFAAAVGAGGMNAVVGAGTLITFPTLLALGYPPVVANVSNTVGLVPGSVAAVYGFRRSLEGRWRLVSRLALLSASGGVVGGALLLVLPPGAFEVVVPVLLVASGVLAAVQPRVADAVLRRRSAPSGASDDDPAARREAAITPLLAVGVAATGVYGGYFGAAQGVILLAVLGVFLTGGMTQVNGVKNVLAGVANLVSALLFVVVADVDVRVAATVALGATLGGGLGGRYGRRLPARPLRAIIVVVALVAAAWQLVT
jgi:uncharacterized protein